MVFKKFEGCYHVDEGYRYTITAPEGTTLEQAQEIMGIAINTGTEITRSVLDMVVVELSTSGQQELAQIARNFVVRAEVVHREALLIELSNKE